MNRRYARLLFVIFLVVIIIITVSIFKLVGYRYGDHSEYIHEKPKTQPYISKTLSLEEIEASKQRKSRPYWHTESKQILDGLSKKPPEQQKLQTQTQPQTQPSSDSGEGEAKLKSATSQLHNKIKTVRPLDKNQNHWDLWEANLPWQDDDSILTDFLTTIGSSDAIDGSMMRADADPCIDFYEYACGAYSESVNNMGKDATFKTLYEKNEARLHAIIKNVMESGQSERPVYKFYNSCLKYYSGKSTAPTKESKLVDLAQWVSDTMTDTRGSKSKASIISGVWGYLQRFDSILPIRMSVEIRPVALPEGIDHDRAQRLLLFLGKSGLFEERNLIDSQQHHDDVKQRFINFHSLQSIRSIGSADEWHIENSSYQRGVIDRLAERDATMTVACEMAILKAFISVESSVKEMALIEYSRSERASNSEFISYEAWSGKDGLLSMLSTTGFDFIQFMLAACPYAETLQTHHTWEIDQVFTPSSTERLQTKQALDCHLWRSLVLREPTDKDKHAEGYDLWVHPIEWIKNGFQNLVSTQSMQAWTAYTIHSVLFHADNGAKIDAGSGHYAYHKSYDATYGLPWMKPQKFTPKANSMNSQYSSSTDHAQICLLSTEAYLPLLLDHYFDEDVFGRNAASKSLVDTIVQSVKISYAQELRQSDVLNSYASPDEVERLAQKVESIHVQIGAPDTVPDAHGCYDIETLSELLSGENYIDNVLYIRYMHVARDMYRLLDECRDSSRTADGSRAAFDGRKIDMLYDQLDSVANAFYQHQFNTITLNAGVLEKPVYDRGYDGVSLFSRLAMFIAHEISHSLDPMGVNFDCNGLVTLDDDILDERFIRGYNDRAQCFVKAYDVKTTLMNTHDGKRTLNENVADVSGFRIAYKAFYKVFSGELEEKAKYSSQQVVARVVAGLTRRFYVSYAQLFCRGAIGSKEERREITTYRHSIPELRVNNVVRQHEMFDSVWQCDDLTHSIHSLKDRFVNWLDAYAHIDSAANTNWGHTYQRCSIF
jgi:predicted metalloendopeptidase